jgi:hydroxyethylthiazole kinase-like uncharacterized protein yjeF
MTEPLYLEASVRGIEDHAASRLAPATLMQRAGQAAANWAHSLLGPSDNRVAVLAGPGNNGGDAAVAAAALSARGREVHLVAVTGRSTVPPDAAHAWAALPAGIHRHADCTSLPPVQLIVDGLFGLGLRRPIGPPYDGWIAWANRQPCPRLSLDVPSGLQADTGAVLGAAAIRATHTLTFLALKPGLFTGDGPDYCGQWRLDALGAEASVAAVAPSGMLLQSDDLNHGWRSLRRSGNSHKGRFGSAGILGGAPGMSGAALLAGRAALKLGAGRVFVGFVDADHLACDPLQPELMLRPAQGLLDTGLPTVLGIGPGLGMSASAQALLQAALAAVLPLVADADALNLIAQFPAARQALQARTAPTVLTPHPLEAARLLGTTAAAIQQDRIGSALRIAHDLRAVVLLKGQGSIIATPAGQWAINPSGNPGLASGGTGDVLTGMIAALLAQSLDAWTAARMGAWLHGSAADRLSAQGVGPIGLAASELIEAARSILNQEVGQAVESSE